MFILMLITMFVLSFISLTFVVQVVDAIKKNNDFNGIAHVVIISACITFLAFYFGG